MVAVSTLEAPPVFRQGGRWFFGVLFRKRTYTTLAYLLLTFPLGVAYFTFLVTGFVTSGALIILLVGIPMLGIVLFLVIELTALERYLAEVLLGAEVAQDDPPVDLRERIWRLVFHLGTWQGVVYLFSKFFLGIVTFVLVTFGATFTFTLVTAPLHYQDEQVGIHLAAPVEIVPTISYQHDGWAVEFTSTLTLAGGEVISTYAETIWAALAVSLLGVLVGIVTLHLFNALGWCYARYTELLLSNTQPSIVHELREEGNAHDG